MPLSRYKIRNEYSLADPHLYRDTDKDDPEALLEGVAMAGLVGVLRQLGDLAEYAAEIFHDLHEEMLVTASRGHDLMIRVQQLEAEVPFIEKTFLLQTDHSSFSYNPGVDWHSKLRSNHNLVTQSDLPRFVMESYEECRGPPRLFLLDKFDVGGAGACLKRFTDPSFFKIETSAMSNTDIQAENKIRKPKRKEQHFINDGRAEVLKRSDAELHQLFLEESVPVSSNGPTPMKLKRRLRWFLFDSKPRKSYMEKLFKTPSSEHEMLHGVSECDHDVLEVTSSNPADEEGILLNEVMEDEHDVSTDKIYEESIASVDVLSHGIMSTLDDETSEVDIHVDEIDIYVDGEGKPESSLIHLSDEIPGEIDNSVDAPSSMEPEFGTDLELRLRNDAAFISPPNPSLVSVETDKHLYSQTSDSRTNGGSMISNSTSSPTRNELSSSISPDSEVSSAEDPLSAINNESFLEIIHEDCSVDRMLNPVVSNDKCSNDVAPDNNLHDLEQLASNSQSDDPLPSLPHFDAEEVENKAQLQESMWLETVSASDYEEKETNIILDSPWSPSAADCKIQPRIEHLGSSSGEYLIDDPGSANAHRTLSLPEIIHDGTDTSAATVTPCLLHKDNCDQADLNYSKLSSSSLCDVHRQNGVDTADPIIFNNSTTGVLTDDACVYPESIPCDNTEIRHSSYDNTLVLSKGEKQEFEFDDDGLNAISDSPNISRSTMQASIGQDLVESHSSHVEMVGNLDQCCSSSIDEQISSEKLVSSVKGYFPFRHEAIIAQGIDAIEGTTLNGPYELEFPSISGGSGCDSAGASDVVVSNDFMDSEVPHSTPSNLEATPGISGILENGCLQARAESGQEGFEISSPSDLKLLNEVHLELDVSDSKRIETMTSCMLTVSGYATGEKFSLAQIVEEHIPDFTDAGGHEHVKDNNDYERSCGESGFTEEASERAASVLDVTGGSCSGIDCDCNHTKLDLSSTVDPDLDSIVEQDAVLIKSPPSSSLDAGQNSFMHSSLEKQIHDASLSHETPGIVLPERRSSEFSPILRSDHQQNNDIKQQTLEYEEKEVEKMPASLFSLINGPTSAAELRGLRNSDNKVSGYPDDPYRFTSPKSSSLTETNQIILDEKPPLPPLPPFKWRIGKLQHSSGTERELVNQKESLPPVICIPIASGDVSSLVKEMNNSLTLYAPGTTSKEDKLEQTSSVVVNSIQETIFLQTEMETKDEEELVRPDSKTEANSTVEEDGVVNASLKGKFSRLPNPLIDSVDALDKSKLRKVSERVKPHHQKVDERDLFLEQIRSKSFNLKPAVSSRPSIQGPKTNLKVAAILEKANAIRQALAGSDEDEENWSDS